MSAHESLRAGRLDEALAELNAEVRKNPARAEHRIFLFQLHAVMGQWEKAFSQLKVLADLDSKTTTMVQTYREALRCAALRNEIFAGLKSPLLFGEPEPWMALMLEALKLGATGHAAQAAAVRAQALESAPTSAGVINGQPFTWIADADSRLGPMLEVIVNGRLYWMPFHRIKAIRVDKPTDLRDLVWLPAFVTLESGTELASLIPTRYPGSENSSDGHIRLARKTEWDEQTEGTFHGRGQRVLATDAEEVPLLDVREITFAERPADPATAGSATPTT